MFQPHRQAVDVALPQQGQIRQLAIDAGGIVEDVDAIITNIASDTLTYSGAGLNGAIGAAEIFPPRNLELVLSNHADWDIGTATIVGTDYADAALTEVLTIADLGNDTLSGVALFKTVVSLTLSAMSGAGGTGTLGVGLIASLQDLTERYVSMVCDVQFHITCGDADVAITTPDPTTVTGGVDASHTSRVPADVYINGRPRAGATDAFKVLGSATGVLEFWPSDNRDGD